VVGLAATPKSSNRSRLPVQVTPDSQTPPKWFVGDAVWRSSRRRLAELAAHEVERYRESFTDLQRVAEFLEAREDGGNPHADAAYAGIA